MKKTFRDEYLGAELGDERRSSRLLELAKQVSVFPEASFPSRLGDGAALEAAYRFFGNPKVEAKDMLEPHMRRTAERCSERGEVVVAHDTTSFSYSEGRKGLGHLNGDKKRGFYAHMALAVSGIEWREPLGVLHAELWKRTKKVTKSGRCRQKDNDRESQRWFRGVEQVEERLEAGLAVHLMDREADDYALFCQMLEGGFRFVIRACHDRCTTQDDKAFELARAEPVIVKREVPLSKRQRSPLPRHRKIHPPRNARMATLGIKATSVELKKPKDLPAKSFPKTLSINVVLVEEIETPENEPPVSWCLYTTEPIETVADIEKVIDAYRCRWPIEEYFKALKSGCRIEKRQLGSYESLLNAIALYVPIAWRMLRLRTLAQHDAERRASGILTPLQIKLLRGASKKKLPPALSVAQALEAIAMLGGHLRRNGSPGWLTIARGYEKLLAFEQGACMAAEM